MCHTGQRWFIRFGNHTDHEHRDTTKPPCHPLKMIDIINILAISPKGKSRLGKQLTTAIVEQRHHDKVFVVIPAKNQCRWIKLINDPDFRIIEEID